MGICFDNEKENVKDWDFEVIRPEISELKNRKTPKIK